MDSGGLCAERLAALGAGIAYPAAPLPACALGFDLWVERSDLRLFLVVNVWGSVLLF